eukprot:CAMPEP_0194545184 /NCGR_PEP_ID=MMETSP0253-20130528/88770_1 /TAXON_ID=2966 /ORGANISM="Noctiluca scintillans" /LENGTH=103 /DNA_ID=CAMNT_0039392159 /DNA_START=403 /DNA_END=711 /DNA_ORIENTATION=+
MISVSSSTEGTYTTILYGSTTAVITDPVFDGSNVPETYIRDQSLVPPPHVLRTRILEGMYSTTGVDAATRPGDGATGAGAAGLSSLPPLATTVLADQAGVAGL